MAQVSMNVARTAQRNPAEAAAHLLSQLHGPQPKLAVLFASRDRDQRELNRQIREKLPANTRLVGATTGGEIDNAGIHQGHALLAALSGDFEVGIGLGRGLSTDAMNAGSTAMENACRELDVNIANIDVKSHVGLVIDDGYRYKKEELLLGALYKNQGLTLVGGGAADTERDPEKQSAEVHVDGEVATDAVMIALFRTNAPWAALRDHAYEPTGRRITITKVDPSGKRALEIDGKLAALRYSELAGVPPEELEFGTPNGFAKLCLALRVGREYFMRAPWKPLPDHSILFANLLEEGTELELMTLGDMPATTRRFFEETVPRRVKNPKAALLFNCGGRMWLAESRGLVKELGDSFGAAPTCAGMNCHFELYCGFHINTTLTSLVFGADA